MSFRQMFPQLEPVINDIAPRLVVLGTGILGMDPDVIHPFVRIHVLDLTTGKYLAKSDENQNGVDKGVAFHESFGAFKYEENKQL